MILPGGTIGILGGGQLGRMLAQSARQHGYGVVVLAPEGDAPAVGLADRAIRASYEDSDAARALADASDVVTYEFENVPARLAKIVAERKPLHPSVELLAITQDRLREHAWLHSQGVATAPGRPVRTVGQLWEGCRLLGYPVRLKSARGGYDGGGQWRLTSPSDVAAVEPTVASGDEYLLEKEVRFEREVSVIVCRDEAGNVETFPIFENSHRDGILVLSSAPARIPPGLARRAEDLARTLAEACRLVGTLTVECFQTADDILVNELAPRVHNSGHLTIEGCSVSQFEQHLRAITGLPLRHPELRGPVAMANVLGSSDHRRVRLEGAADVMALPGVSLHLYGKAAVRARRKMGHVTALGADVDDAREVALRAAGLLHFA